ncbi:hypothetical protein [Neptunicella sp. SCSIO 80796]|uniref:hypothetical protein n=1 Tax=Neptunicella plasticusilytica TaxID=3117012 RepID=UPI003A4D7EF7
MSNVIQLLEKIGVDANLQDQAQFAQAIQQSGLSDELQQALLNRDKSSLQQQLNVASKMAMMIVTPDDDDDDGDTPSQIDVQTVDICS